MAAPAKSTEIALFTNIFHLRRESTCLERVKGGGKYTHTHTHTHTYMHVYVYGRRNKGRKWKKKYESKIQEKSKLPSKVRYYKFSRLKE